jgi:two-component system, NarL family, invasion response regulator UvrY
MRIIIITDDFSVQTEIKKALQPEFPGASIQDVNEREWMELLNREEFSLAIISSQDEVNCLPTTISLVHQYFPDMPVLVIGSHPEPGFLHQLLEAKSAGYLYKDGVSKELIKAVRIVLQERHYFPLQLERKLAENQEGGLHKLPHEGLSAREYDVFKSLASGKTVSEIAHTNTLGITTVSTYRSRLLAKLGFKTNAEVIAYAKKHQLV